MDSGMRRFALAGAGLIAAVGCSTSATGPPAASSTPARQIVCQVTEAHLTFPSFQTYDTDVVVGSISWPKLKTWATADPNVYRNARSASDFKIGAQVKAGAVVTVSVAQEARAYAGLDYGQASGYGPTSSVTFHSCATADTAFVGGFHVEGRHCVPFDISEDHKPLVRIVISFFNGPCGSA